LTAHLVGAKKNAEALALLGLPEVTLDWDWSEDAE